MAQRSHKRAGRPECELFDDQHGPLKRRTEIKEGIRVTLKGAICWACGKDCKKTNRISWLYHIAGKDGDAGQGWAKCKDQDKFDERDMGEWRDELEEMLAARNKSKRVSPRRESGAPSSAGARTDGGLEISFGDEGSENDGERPDERPRMPGALKSRLKTLEAMTCFEGNIAPYGLCQNMSHREQLRAALSLYADGDTWKPPDRKTILGSLLTECRGEISKQATEVFLGDGPTVLTSDGWDSIRKLKLINFNFVGSMGAMFHHILDQSGRHPDSPFIAQTIIDCIKSNGGAENFAQVVMDNCSVNVNANDIIEKEFAYMVICSGCLAHMLNLAFKEIVELAYVESCFKQLIEVVSFFNVRKCLFLPLLHKRMHTIYSMIYALLGYVSTRFYSRATTIKSALRAKDALVATVMSSEFDALMNESDAEPKRAARECKAIVQNTQNWLKAEAIIKWITPLTDLQLLMGRDIGDALPFFYPKMEFIKRLWDKQLSGQRTKAYGGVSHTFSLAANKLLFEKWEKFSHSLHGTSALLHPINLVPRIEAFDKSTGYPYCELEVPIGVIPAEPFLDSLQAEFGDFIQKYVPDSGNRTELREELEEFLKCCRTLGMHSGSKIKSDAFSATTLKKYMLDFKRWFEIYGKGLKHLQCLVVLCVARCKPSSSSAERNWSIWGIVQTKLRNRLTLDKAEALVFIYQNLRAIRKAKGDECWCPNLSGIADDSGEADTDDFDADELMKWWAEWHATNQAATAFEDNGEP